MRHSRHRFNLPAMQASASTARSSRVISSLHTIMRPFLLRRLKVDVETNLPPKKEYVLYAPLSERQREVYDAIVQGGLRALLLQKQGVKAPEKLQVDDNEKDVGGRKITESTRSKKRGRPSKKPKSYDVDGDDDEYFKKLESGELEAEQEQERLAKSQQLGREWQYKTQRKSIPTI